MAKSKKRRLTDEELVKLRYFMDSAPQGRKPTVRQLARYFGVNQPSIIKSLGDWDGVHRNIQELPPKATILSGNDAGAVKIEGYTSKTEVSQEEIINAKSEEV